MYVYMYKYRLPDATQKLRDAYFFGFRDTNNMGLSPIQQYIDDNSSTEIQHTLTLTFPLACFSETEI